jgi:hypothetical protein
VHLLLTSFKLWIYLPEIVIKLIKYIFVLALVIKDYCRRVLELSWIKKICFVWTRILSFYCILLFLLQLNQIAWLLTLQQCQFSLKQFLFIWWICSLHSFINLCQWYVPQTVIIRILCLIHFIYLNSLNSMIVYLLLHLKFHLCISTNSSWLL